MFVRPLCRVWNTTALIGARLWDTEAGQEEEYVYNQDDLNESELVEVGENKLDN